MIKEYNIKCGSCGTIVRFQTFKPTGMINEEVMLPIEKDIIDKISYQKYFREKIENQETLILEDTVMVVPVYRTLVFKLEDKRYVDYDKKNNQFSKEFIKMVCYGEIDKLRLVDVIGETK
jgi:hypothetical protein